MDILNLIKDKSEVIATLLKTIESNDKMSKGLRNMLDTNESEYSSTFKIEKLLEVVANQSVQIKQLSVLLLIYTQGSNFDSDVGKLMLKMGRGEEALRQILKNKMK